MKSFKIFALSFSPAICWACQSGFRSQLDACLLAVGRIARTHVAVRSRAESTWTSIDIRELSVPLIHPVTQIVILDLTYWHLDDWPIRQASADKTLNQFYASSAVQQMEVQMQLLSRSTLRNTLCDLLIMFCVTNQVRNPATLEIRRIGVLLYLTMKHCVTQAATYAKIRMSKSFLFKKMMKRISLIISILFQTAYKFQENLLRTMIQIENTYFELAKSCRRNCLVRFWNPFWH